MNREDTMVDLAALEQRARDTAEWLKRNGRECFDEQKHLDQNTQERIYWHYGYLIAIRDVIRFLTGEVSPINRARSSTPSDTYN